MISFFLVVLIFLYVLDTNSKIKTLHRKIYHEDENEKLRTFKRLSQNIGETIQIKIKESYAELGLSGGISLDTISANKVKVLKLNKDWVHLEVYGKQTTQKIIRLESIESIDD